MPYDWLYENLNWIKVYMNRLSYSNQTERWYNGAIK